MVLNMLHLWSREKPVDSVLLSKLVQLARGNVALVNEAVRTFQRDNEEVPLPDVVEYISKHRDDAKWAASTPHPAPSAF